MKTDLALFLLLCVISIPVLAEPGIVVTSKTHEVKTSKTSNSTLYMNQTYIKMVDGSQAVIFDTDKESITVLDHDKKEAMIISKQEMISLKQQLKVMMEMMEQQLKNLPPEQQEMVKKNMSGMMPTEGKELNYEYRLVNSEVSVKNWSSTQYEGLVNGEKRGEIFLADYDEVGFQKSDFAALEKMASFMREILADFSDRIDFGGSGSSFFGFGGEDNPIFTKGLPVKMIEYSGDDVERVVTIEDISRQDLDNSTFEVPGGYRQTTLQEQMKGMFGQ